MLTYQVKKNLDSITTIKVNGHALFARYGNDIVCASVSTAIIVTLNAIESLGLKDNINFELKEGKFCLKVLNEDQNLNALLKNLEFTLNDLRIQYPKNLKED